MKRHIWTRKEVALLQREYPDRPARELADRLGVSSPAIYHQAAKLGLKKSPAFFANTKLSGRLDGVKGLSGRFKKGQVSWNKGMKGLQIGGKSTQFKKGNRSHTWVPVGTIVHESKDKYLKIKVAEPNRWEFVHRRNWEAVHGKIPTGMIITFKDGNKENCDVSNLEMISRAEHGRRAKLHQYPEELRHAIHLRGALSRQINKKEKA